MISIDEKNKQVDAEGCFALSTIQQLNKGQYIANIPKAIALALGWHKGDKISWEIKEGHIELKKRGK